MTDPTTSDNTFAAYGIVEVMGHQTYAGRITEQTIAGSGFIRVDIPRTSSDEPFSKLFSPGSIYAITPTTEEIARAMAERYAQRPLTLYDLPQEWKEKIRRPAIIEREPQAVPRLDDDPDFDDDLDDDEQLDIV